MTVLTELNQFFHLSILFFILEPGPQPTHHSGVMHPQMPAQLNQQHQQRYRGNRQVYVPPAQRK